MLKNQLIAFLFASVLSANMGHNIFPHHHHYDSLISHQGCQEHDDENSFEAGDPTSFCHAFNGIEYYPAPEKQDISKPFKTAEYICLSQVIELDQPISHWNIIRSSRGSPPLMACLMGSSTGLRAPPCLS